MIGNGVEKLVERAFAATGERARRRQRCEREQMAMIDIYAKHLTGLTVLMPGAREVLDALHGDGIPLGLVTNKPQRFIETILDHFGLSSLFGAVIGGDAGVTKKPAPDMLLAAIEQLGVAAGRRRHGRRQRVRRRVGAGGRHRRPSSCAAATPTFRPKQLGADIVIDDMTELAGGARTG